VVPLVDQDFQRFKGDLDLLALIAVFRHARCPFRPMKPCLSLFIIRFSSAFVKRDGPRTPPPAPDRAKKAGCARSHFRTALQSRAARCSLHDSSRNFLLYKQARRNPFPRAESLSLLILPAVPA
ncbi:MAG: hypothetical protein MSD70_01195, partial [Clostridiales bacterium]|nr:hypothetical protein [Clostridiales bacterium]